MPVKPNRKKKTSAPRAAARQPAAQRSGKNHRSPPATAYYVSVSPPAVAIVRDKPKAGKAQGPCADFEQAKSAAIEALITAIEDGERQLTRCKRATRLDELCGK